MRNPEMRRRVLSLAAATAALTMVLSGPFPAAARNEATPAAAPVPAPGEAAPYVPLESTPAAPNPAVPADYEQVSETPSLRLYINRGDSKLIVEDKRNGKLWA